MHSFNFSLCSYSYKEEKIVFIFMKLRGLFYFNISYEVEIFGVLSSSHIAMRDPDHLYPYFSWPQSVTLNMTDWFPVNESSALASCASIPSSLIWSCICCCCLFIYFNSLVWFLMGIWIYTNISLRSYFYLRHF